MTQPSSWQGIIGKVMISGQSRRENFRPDGSSQGARSSEPPLPAAASASLVLILILASTSVAQPTVGLINYDESASFVGYTLISPFPSDVTYLLDNWGRVVHTWTTGGSPLKHAYLLENGTLVKTQNHGGETTIDAPGSTSTVRMYDWDGNLFWDFTYLSADHRLHHDIEPMPNGNVLMIAWERKDAAAIIAAGGDPTGVENEELWPDHIIEVDPTGLNTGDIVWEWHMWDHLIQDFDNTKANFGVVADHPELIDIGQTFAGDSDWSHVNGVAYNPDLDQIALSAPRFNELWIIDHSTTTAEAAGHTGGNQGMGGDLLYRWGNPAMYGRGTSVDQKLFFQHDVHWIAPGLNGEGNLLIFNNRNPAPPAGPTNDYSTVDELVTPVQGDGSYPAIASPTPHGPTDFVWSYGTANPQDFIGRALSGSQRLPNGNTLVCNGAKSDIFEVTDDSVEVWRYVSPITDTGLKSQGETPDQSSNLYFKCNRYAPTYPAFDGRDLTPGFPIEPGTAQHVALVSPADSAESVGTTPAFDWDPSAYSDTYRIQVSTAVDFSSTEIDVAGLVATDYTPAGKTAALSEGEHFWRVQSSNSFGPGAWSETRVLWTGAQTIDIEVTAKVFLEGPFGGAQMAVSPLLENARPLEQPYDSSLYAGSHLAYAGSESVAGFVGGEIDWVLVSLRSTPSDASQIAQQAAIVLEDGSVVAPDGSTLVFGDLPADSYYLVVRHRNHMSVMSDLPINFSSGAGAHDFTTAMSNAYSDGGSPMKALAGGVFGMFAADGNFDGQITASDFNLWIAATTSGLTGYQPADYNLDGHVTAPDFNLWIANTTAGASSQVPE